MFLSELGLEPGQIRIPLGMPRELRHCPRDMLRFMGCPSDRHRVEISALTRLRTELM